MSPTLEKDTTPLALNIMKSDNPAVQRDGKLEPPGRTFSTFCNVFEVPSGIPLPWRYIVGSLLTVIYLVGAILLFSFYLIQNNKNGVSTVMDDKFVSSKDLEDAAKDGYICTCDFPPEIRSVAKPDTRNKTINRCYNPEEAETVKGELNILQYNSLWHEFLWQDYISQLTNKKNNSRHFDDGLRPKWESYELRALNGNDSSDVPFGIHLADLSSKLDAMGYVGQVGEALLEYLSSDSFLTVPAGFIQARVDYNCTSCSECELLWKKYDSVQAKNASKEAVSWAFCDEYPSRVPGQDEGCSGFCRYFRTHDRPWGVELNNMARELLNYVDAPENTTVIFHPRLLYANISEVEHDVSYDLTFLEVDREGTTWLRFTDYFGPIQNCGENNVLICTGRSICEIAPIYSFQSANSEELNAQCEFYATGLDYQINRTKCEEIVKGADLRFVIDWKNTSVSDILCQDYQCQSIIPTQVLYSDSLEDWRSFRTGEAALNNLLENTARLIPGFPEFCTNNYTDVLVVYEDKNDEEEEPILSIHELSCSSGNSTGSGNSKLCWLTGRYKNMTDTWNEDWKHYNFSADETESGKTMFACYKFREKSFRSRMWDFFGIVSGIIGSWLLILSCIYWSFLRTPPRKLAFLFGPLPSQSDDPAPAPSVSSNIYEEEKTKPTWESRLDVETNRRMADFPSERIGPYTL